MMNYPHFKRTAESELDWFEALTSLARFLRSPEGCPWDREHGSRDFAGFLDEEGKELLEAFEGGDNEHIEEEFGDAFFCLLAVAAAAEEEGRFTLEGALRRIHEKMIRRHAHVFGAESAATPEDAVEVWKQVKAEERRAKSRGHEEEGDA